MAARAAEATEVAVVGAGPVGLLLAALLVTRGIACRVLERRDAPAAHSRSVGIHPVALEIFDELGIAERFLAAGHRIERGQAWVGGRHLGTLDFACCPPPYRFVLTLPQYRTEALLEERLRELDPQALSRGATVDECRPGPARTTVAYERGGRRMQLASTWVAGCDGRRSRVREAAGIGFRDGVYADTYIMGDFDDGGARPDAEIHLHPSGLVESIPLPAGRRRWVVMTRALLNAPTRADIVERVRRRLAVDLSGKAHYMLSAFGVRHGEAAAYVRGPFVLAGDAAHVVSPIGGQGMNLGWLDARRLADALTAAHAGDRDALRRYDEARRAAARKARRRGEFNMALGRRHRVSWPRQSLVRALLVPPVAARMARVFTMRGL